MVQVTVQGLDQVQEAAQEKVLETAAVQVVGQIPMLTIDVEKALLQFVISHQEIQLLPIVSVLASRDG